MPVCSELISTPAHRKIHKHTSDSVTSSRAFLQKKNKDQKKAIRRNGERYTEGISEKKGLFREQGGRARKRQRGEYVYQTLCRDCVGI